MKGWEVEEEYGMALSNPRPVTRIILPEEWSIEQREAFLEGIKILYPEEADIDET